MVDNQSPAFTPNEFETSLIERMKDQSAGEDGFLAQLRAQAQGSFAQSGLPHRRVEPWKYSDLRARVREPETAVAEPADWQEKLPPEILDWAGPRILFVDGVFQGAWSSLPDGFAIEPLVFSAEQLALYENAQARPVPGDDRILTMNNALFSGGIVGQVEKGAATDPVLLLSVETGAKGAGHLQSVLEVMPGAQLTLVSYRLCLQPKNALPTSVLRVHVGEGAQFRQTVVQDGNRENTDLSKTIFTLEAHATVDSLSLTRFPGFVRQETDVLFAGPQGRAALRGVTVLDKVEHADTTTYVRHAAEDCGCEEDFRTVLLDKSKGVFQGKIFVEAEAQKTDSQMNAKGLLISDLAEMDLKPELEIYADDVKCSHGATVGALDEKALFYLTARGIPRPEAQRLLVGGFLRECTADFGEENGQKLVDGLAEEWLAAHF